MEDELHLLVVRVDHPLLPRLELDPALVDSGEVDVLAVPARAKAAWLALLAGDTARVQAGGGSHVLYLVEIQHAPAR